MNALICGAIALLTIRDRNVAPLSNTRMINKEKVLLLFKVLYRYGKFTATK